MRRRWLFAGAAALAAMLLAGLGVWQVERLAWKRALIAKVDARVHAAPVALPPERAWARLAQDGEYLRVRVSGAWVPGAPAFIQAATARGPGWWAISGLRTDGGVVAINRGFVPQDARARIAAPTGNATVTGLLRLTEPGGGFLRHNDPARDRWFSRDVAAIAKARGWGAAAPFFIDADAAPGTRYPLGGMTVIRFPNNHLIYAITWFALAALAGWFAAMILRGRGQPGRGEGAA